MCIIHINYINKNVYVCKVVEAQTNIFIDKIYKNLKALEE